MKSSRNGLKLPSSCTRSNLRILHAALAVAIWKNRKLTIWALSRSKIRCKVSIIYLMSNYQIGDRREAKLRTTNLNLSMEKVKTSSSSNLCLAPRLRISVSGVRMLLLVRIDPMMSHHNSSNSLLSNRLRNIVRLPLAVWPSLILNPSITLRVNWGTQVTSQHLIPTRPNSMKWSSRLPKLLSQSSP